MIVLMLKSVLYWGGQPPMSNTIYIERAVSASCAHHEAAEFQMLVQVVELKISVTKALGLNKLKKQ